jgi:hypothetical protein
MKKKNNKRYQLILTEQQCNVIKLALECYSRMGMGQYFTSIEMSSPFYKFKRINNNLEATTELWDTQKVNFLCRMIKNEILGLDANEYFGIHSTQINDTYRQAWDIEQVIRHKISWDNNPTGGSTVNYHEPMKSSNQEELPLIERVD